MHARSRAAAASAAPQTAEKKATPFAWQLREASLALAPWTSDARRQAFVRAAVVVAEQSEPQYALTIAASVLQSDLQSAVARADARNGMTAPTRKQSVQATRKVTKPHMVRAFERAVSGREEDASFARLKTRRLDNEPSRASRDVDDTVRQWLLRGKAAPSRHETVLWLLSRMVLVRMRDDGNENGESAWELLICGEAGAAEAQQPITVLVSPKRARASELEGGSRANGEKRDSGAVRRSDWGDSDEDLPEYREPSRHTHGYSDIESDTSSDDCDGNGDDELDGRSDDEFGFGAATGGGDEHMAAGAAPDESVTMHADMSAATVKDGARSSPAAFVSTPATSANIMDERYDVGDQDNERQRPSRAQLSSATTPKFAFEPAALRTRHRSSSASRTSRSASDLDSALTNEWTQDRRSFQLELHRSKKDIRDARELQRRTEAVAHLRSQQIRMQSQRKLRAHDQRREDASKVAQLLSDTLEYHEILHTLEAQVTRTKISAKREQERLAHSMRVAIGQGDKHVKGPVLGPGPLSQLEIDALGRRGRTNGRHPQQERDGNTFVYDLHGRRHAADDSGGVATLGAFEAAMRRIKRALDRNGTGDSDLVHRFRVSDADRSGTLSRSEFERVLTTCGVTLTREQVHVLFQHFDPNRSGEIDYGELLWGFFNRRAFLKKWQLRKTKLSPHEIKLLFYQYDRAGRGALSLRDFQLAMDDIGFQLAGDELKLLALKFDANHDGFIDYYEFHAFVSGGDLTAADAGESRSEKIGGVPRDRSQSESVEQVLAELRVLSETQARIRQSIR